MSLATSDIVKNNNLGFDKDKSKTKIVVAMSGGVDSSVVAALLKSQHCGAAAGTASGARRRSAYRRSGRDTRGSRRRDSAGRVLSA